MAAGGDSTGVGSSIDWGGGDEEAAERALKHRLQQLMQEIPDPRVFALASSEGAIHGACSANAGCYSAPRVFSRAGRRHLNP